MLDIGVGELHHNSILLQPANCAGPGGLEDAGSVHCGRDNNCGSLCALSFHKCADSVDAPII